MNLFPSLSVLEWGNHSETWLSCWNKENMELSQTAVWTSISKNQKFAKMPLPSFADVNLFNTDSVGFERMVFSLALFPLVFFNWCLKNPTVGHACSSCFHPKSSYSNVYGTFWKLYGNWGNGQIPVGGTKSCTDPSWNFKYSFYTEQ